MLHRCVYDEWVHKQHIRRTMTRTITAYSVSGNVLRVHQYIYATRKRRVEKGFTVLYVWWMMDLTRCYKTEVFLHLSPRQNARMGLAAARPLSHTHFPSFSYLRKWRFMKQHSDIKAMCCTSTIIFCDICCFGSASWRMSSLKGIVNW